MPSLLDGIILALVIEKPSYGYEIHQRFVRRFGEFLSAGLTSVYDALARLEEDEYVEVAGQSGARGRPRVNFRATDRGMDVHLSWLAECLRDPERFTVLRQLGSTSLRRRDAKLKLIDRFVDQSSKEAREIAMPECDDGLLLDLLIELRRRLVDAQLGWGAYARSRLLESDGPGKVGE